jgi:hypothetical protein
MADQRLDPGDEPPPALVDDNAQRGVLAILLNAHPGQRSIDEVVRQMTDRPDEFAARDRSHNAIRDLVAAGLAHRHVPFVFATRAAVRFNELAS